MGPYLSHVFVDLLYSKQMHNFITVLVVCVYANFQERVSIYKNAVRP